MELELKGLLIHKRSSMVDELADAFQPELAFEVCDHAASMHSALEQQIESDYNICFISDTFPEQEVKDFIRDYGILTKDRPCVFVQLRESLELESDRLTVQKMGLATVVSKAGDQRDKAALWKALTPILELLERKNVLKDVAHAAVSLVSEVDRVAKARIRGKKTKFSKVHSAFVEKESKVEPAVLEEYYRSLMDAADEAPPFEVKTVQIPEEMLRMKLPNLEETRYTGASHRVWDKLLNRHGVRENVEKKESPSQADETEDSSSDTPESEKE